MRTVMVLNGPNLNLLGMREPDVYGASTLADVEELCRKEAASAGVDLDFRQTNSEGELVNWVQEAGREHAAGRVVGAVINPAGYTHTSVALQDAVRATGLPVVEVHISNVHAREGFRQHSYLSPVAAGIVAGFGILGYPLGLRGLLQLSAPGPGA